MNTEHTKKLLEENNYDELIIECTKVIPIARYHALLDTNLLGMAAFDYKDLYQEGALAICRKIKDYDESKGDLDVYVYILAYWGIRNYLKKNQNFYCDTCELNDEINTCSITEPHSTIKAIIDSLSIDERSLINDIYIKKRRLVDIASEMHVPKERISIERDRILTKIRQRMSD